MSEYYSGLYGSRKKVQRSPFAILLDTIMLVVTVPVVLIFIALLFTPAINPHSIGVLSTLGLVAPFVYGLMLVLTLYWVLRWRKIAIALLFFSFVGLFSLTQFYRPELKRYYDKSYPKEAIKVMTYNTRSFINDNGERCLDSVVAIVRELRPDVLCFQEMGFSSIADSMLRELKYSPLPSKLSRKDLSPMIYSRHQIVRAERIDTMKNFVWADVVIRKDTFRIFNNHLHTTAIRREEGHYIENHQYLEEEGDLSKLGSMLHRLSENNKLRSSQVDTITRIIRQSPYPVVVCGDFNDTPISYTYRNMSRRLNDAFRRVGRGYSHTYRGFFDMLRIDYIFYSDDFEALSYEVIDSWGLKERVRGRGDNADTIMVRTFGNQLPMPSEAEAAAAGIVAADNKVAYSDHYPVFVRLMYNPKN